MRALAEHVMKGRTQAVVVAVLATGTVFFAWVAAAVIALVTLRKGTVQGSKVLLWALLPALVIAAFGDTGPVTSLLGVMLAATVLRSTGSWSWGLVAASASGVVTAVSMAAFGRGYIEQILQVLAETIGQMSSQAGAEAGTSVVMPSALQVMGLLGLSNGISVVMCLILARWWQAMLYNPGGFQAEFHQLRLPPLLTVGLLVVGLAISTLGADYRLWAMIFALPLVFAGFGLIHGLVAMKGLSNKWLGLVYICWLLLDSTKALLIVVAVADSWLDFRGRVAKGQKPD